MAKLTTTYNELKELGACKEGLETLWKWLTRKHGVFRLAASSTWVPSEFFPLTPADILESNGVEHLGWAVSKVPSWKECWHAVSGVTLQAWAKEVSGRVEPTKTLAKDLKVGDKIMLLGEERRVHHACADGQVVLAECGKGRGGERFDPETLDAIRFTLIKPKREPRRLKAEQILVPENVGTKWRCGCGVAEVRRHPEDSGAIGLWRHDEGRWVGTFYHILVDLWEEVIE